PSTAEPLGDFRIVREIGRGGMGVVYEAVQLSLGRRVALKVLPFAAALDAKHLQRFKTEAHAAAQLHHSNIVPVYAVGCERGVHFYAMQLIEGRPLDLVIRELRGDPAARPGGNTTTEYRAGGSTLPTGPTPPVGSSTRGSRGRDAYRTTAALIAQVADALEYAHDAGVVHRDIKPANLLLDPKGAVWVTDFGLAQVTADAGLTRTGDVFGTLRYSSPEQASGRRVLVDHRTDVYSLGATLYELLTLEPIFPGEDRHTLLKQILSDDPRPPRQIDRGIPPELETIILKATAKAPEDRYATAGEFAADLRRFLDELPILARRPSAWDHARKWLRRHPAYVGAAVVVLLLGVVGLAVSTALVAREKDRTEQALHNERDRAQEAEQRFQLARRSADEMIRIADEEQADGPMGQESLRRRLLEAALTYYQEFIELRRDDPSAQAELELTRKKAEDLIADLAVMQASWRHGLVKMGKAVEDDLGLTPTQRDRLRDIGPDGKDVPGSPTGGRQALVARVKAHEAILAATLTPEQFQRLDQIALQVSGPMAFRQPEVIAALSLTPEQQDRIRKIDVFMPKGPKGPRPGPRKFDKGPAPNTDWQDPTDRILTVLTDEQRQRWRQLTGKKFEFWPRDRHFGPFGPGEPPR
ncbi:MAG: serine/threonine-protein kinase, partial [Gemmataceae bacterium]